MVTTPSEASKVTMSSSITIGSQWPLIDRRRSVIWLLSERECPRNHQSGGDLRRSTVIFMSSQSAVDRGLVERRY